MKIGFEDEMPVSLTDEADTKEVDFDAYDDLCGIKSVHLTECGDPDKTEMLEAYDLYETD